MADRGEVLRDSDELLIKPNNCTLQRNTKIGLSKHDMIELLSQLEAELQAKDITIATLQAEKAKQFLYQAKYGRFRMVEPFHALQRDSELSGDVSFDESAIKAMYDDQLMQLENLITTQHTSQQQMREQLSAIDKQYHQTCMELEDVKLSHTRDMEQCDNVIHMLEKERDRLKQEIEIQKVETRKLEAELQKSAEGKEESSITCEKHKQVAAMLIKERQALVKKILDLRQTCTTLVSELAAERSKVRDIELTHRGSTEQEHKQMLERLAIVEEQNKELSCEIGRLRAGNISSSGADKRFSTDLSSLGVRKSGADISSPVRQSPHTYISERTVCPTSPVATQTMAVGRTPVESMGSRNSSVSGSLILSPKGSAIGNTAVSPKGSVNSRTILSPRGTESDNTLLSPRGIAHVNNFISPRVSEIGNAVLPSNGANNSTLVSPRGAAYSGRIGSHVTSSLHSLVEPQNHCTSIILPEPSKEFTITTVMTSGVMQKTSVLDRGISPHSVSNKVFLPEVASQSVDHRVFQPGSTARVGANPTNTTVRERTLLSSMHSETSVNNFSYMRPGSSAMSSRLSGSISRDLSPNDHSKTFSHVW